MSDTTRPGSGLTRRRFLQGSLALASAVPVASAGALPANGAATVSPPARNRHVAVVGAGALGGWSAYELLRRGARVTLLDSWGPGNGRASSGGETRVIRSLYGSQEIFTDLALRALELWHEHEERFGQRLYRRTGMLVLGADEMILEGLPILMERGVAIRELELATARKRYPQIDFAGLERVFEDDDTGYLLAREACRTVVEHFVAEGGDYRRASVRPGKIESGRLAGVTLADGSILEADLYLFACGSWLPGLFPGVVGEKIAPSRQEVYYFGPPAGDARFSEDRLPVWTDRTSGGYYGIPGNRDRGFKIANHHLGPSFDPTGADRVPSAAEIERARSFLGRRFPALAAAPLVEARVCHYANTRDELFVIDRHPEAGNLWLAGGGSGHAFKHGPALGELIAGWMLAGGDPEPGFSLRRFADAGSGAPSAGAATAPTPAG